MCYEDDWDGGRELRYWAGNCKTGRDESSNITETSL